MGIAVQTDPEQPSPETQISESNYDEIIDAYRSWSGRWLLIGKDEIHLDASAQLGCYYVLKEIVFDSELPWISSSPALLRDIIGEYSGRTVEQNLQYNKGIEWYFLPSSPLKNIKHLLPSQKINIETRAVSARRFIEKIADVSVDNILPRFEQHLVTFFKNIQTQGRISLALTAGIDSRLVLAGAYKSGIDINTFTFKKDGLSIADEYLPPKLAKDTGYNHEIVGPNDTKQDYTELVYQQTAGSCSESMGRSGSGWDHFQNGDIVLRGSCFEVGRCFYWKKFVYSDQDTLVDANNIARLFGEKPTPELISLINEWRDWYLHYESKDFDWRDVFYIEQRLAGWLSAIELSLDILPVERLSPVNFLSAYDMMLSLPAYMRCGGQYQLDLIKKMAPALAKYPINPDNPIAYPELFPSAVRLKWGLSQDKLYPLKWLFNKLLK